MAPSTVTFRPPTTDSVIDQDCKPFFDGDDMKLPLFMTALQRYTEEHHSEYAAFLENNYSFDNRKCIVWTTEQAVLIATDKAPTHSFSLPPKALAPTDTKLEEDLKERFQVAPERLRSLSRAMHGFYVSRIDRGTANEIEKDCDSDGCKILTKLHTRLTQKSQAINNAVDVHLRATISAGIGDTNISSLNTFVTELNMWNDAKTATSRMKESQLAAAVSDAIRDLGDFLKPRSTSKSAAPALALLPTT